MARYLAGESSKEDIDRLENLLKSHPELIAEYEFFCSILNKKNTTEEDSPPKNKFDRITKRLKDEGSL